MLLTSLFKFKKRELTDSPPDITATESNWDIVESELARGFRSEALLESGDLLEYIGHIPRGKQISLYVGDKVTNTPVKGNFYIMQIYSNVSTWDRHIRAQEYSGSNTTGKQYVADLWNFTGTSIPWKELATTDKSFLPHNGNLITGSESVLDTIKEVGMYHIGNLNSPNRFDWSILEVTRTNSNGGYIKQTITGVVSRGQFYRTCTDTGVWGPMLRVGDPTSAMVDQGILRTGSVLGHILSLVNNEGALNGSIRVASPTGLTDLPPNEGWGVIEYRAHASTIWSVNWYCDNGKRYSRKIHVDQWEKNWELQATAETLDVSNSLLNGWTTTDYRSNLLQKCGGQVNGMLHIKGGVSSYGTSVCVLPVGFRPAGNTEAVGVCYDGTTWLPCVVYIESNGNVGVYNIPNNQNVVIGLNFIIGGM